MNLPMQFCLRSLRQISPDFRPKYICTARVQLLSKYVNKCTKFSAVALSQTVLEKPHDEIKEIDRNEVLLIKNLLAGHQFEQEKEEVIKRPYQNISVREKRPCTSEGGQCNYKNQLVWQDIFLGHTRKQDQSFRTNSNLIGVNHEMWYCTNIDDACPKKSLSHVEFSELKCSNLKDSSVTERQKSSGPSPEQLSLILLRLREELPNFFEGHHQYSIYSKDILFVNKMTRTTTRTLKSYKYIMQSMEYAGRLFWTRASLDVLRITKHAEDNTIKVRWTAKGIPWFQLPFFLMSGKPESLFYRYVDGFSIFEVGRDGLVHCHRLDKVMPISSPERQKWSFRMLVLSLLGLGEVTHEPSFQIKTQEVGLK